VSSVAKRRRPRVRIGDVFAVPCRDSVSFVQLVGNKSWPGAPEVKDAARYLMYLAVFEGLNKANEFENWQPQDKALRALFLSAPGWPHEDWVVVGSRAVSPHIPFPAYRASAMDEEFVEDYSGQKRRPASREEFRRLRSETSWTSGGLEELVLIVNGLGPDTNGLLKDFAIQPEDCWSCFLFPV
jgi:hypothetical protein